MDVISTTMNSTAINSDSISNKRTREEEDDLFSQPTKKAKINKKKLKMQDQVSHHNVSNQRDSHPLDYSGEDSLEDEDIQLGNFTFHNKQTKQKIMDQVMDDPDDLFENIDEESINLSKGFADVPLFMQPKPHVDRDIEIDDVDVEKIPEKDLLTDNDAYFMSMKTRSENAFARLRIPFDQTNDDETNSEVLQMQLEIMDLCWSVESLHHRYQKIPNLWEKVARRNLGIPLDGPVSPQIIEEAYKNNAQMLLSELHVRFTLSGLLHEEHPNRQEYMAKFSRCFDKSYHLFLALYSMQRFIYLDRNSALSEVPSSLPILRYTAYSQVFDHTKFQKALFNVLLKLKNSGLRRYERDIYEPIISDGYYTYAWRKLKSVEEYCFNCFNIDSEVEDFLSVSTSGNVPKEVAEFICHLNSNYCLELNFNRNLLSFKNGLYFLRKDVFIPYEKTVIGDGTYVEEMEKLRNEIEDLTPNFRHGSSVEMRNQKYPSLVSCNYFDMVFQDWKHQDQIKEREVPIKIEKQSNKERKEKLKKEWQEREKIRKKSWKSGKWTDIYTPAFESILQAQGFTYVVIWWCYVFTGMSLYYGGDLDNWQVALLILGYAGTGKSTWLRLIREFYQLSNVGILSNNIEKQWALASIYNKYVVLGYEVKKDFKWEQGEFQNCVTHEEVLVFIKHKTAFATPFLAPIFMAGNEMITAWQDNSGSLARRLVVIFFRKFIPKDQIDPRLIEKMIDEIPDMLQKANRAYLEAVELYGDQDIWMNLPPEFKDWNEEAMESTNILQSFLKNHNGCLVLGDEAIDKYCLFNDFKKVFKAWAHHNNLFDQFEKVKWNQDFYGSIFSRMKIFLRKNDPMEDGSGRVKAEDRLYGICLDPEWETKFSKPEMNRKKSYRK